MNLRKQLSSAPWQCKTASKNPGFLGNIEEQTVDNGYFRKVLFTAHNCQLVLMSLKPGEDIGMEVHPDIDQFIRFDQGKGRVVMDDFEAEIEDGFAIIVPKGTRHNVINTSETEDLRLYTVYSPPHHRKDVVHKTKADAEADKTDEFNKKETDVT